MSGLVSFPFSDEYYCSLSKKKKNSHSHAEKKHDLSYHVGLDDNFNVKFHEFSCLNKIM